ncbi:MAG: hypothetical protein VB858_04770 [Planctomycetaceae bacterium]
MPNHWDPGLHHFETGTEKGFVTGTVSDRGLVCLFESTGTYEVDTAAQNSKVDTWEELVECLCLVQQTADE